MLWELRLQMIILCVFFVYNNINIQRNRKYSKGSQLAQNGITSALKLLSFSKKEEAPFFAWFEVQPCCYNHVVWHKQTRTCVI